MLHIWAADGQDAWAESIWACIEDESEECVRKAGYENASGVQIPNSVLDEYVIMRLAELLFEGTAIDVLKRVISKYPWRPPIDECADQLLDALSKIKLER